MSASRDDVEALARLARLRLSSEEAESLSRDLTRILEHVRSLEDPGEGELQETRDRQGDASFGDSPPEPDRLRRPPSEAAGRRWREGFFVVPRIAALDRGEPGERKA